MQRLTFGQQNMEDPNKVITPENPEPTPKNDEFWPQQQQPEKQEPLVQPSLVRSVATGDKIFLIHQDKKMWITSPEALHALGCEFGDEEEVSYRRLDQYPDGESVTITNAETLKTEIGDKIIKKESKPKEQGAEVQTDEQRPVEAKDEGSIPSSPANEMVEVMVPQVRMEDLPNPSLVQENFYYELNGKRPEAIFIIPIIRSDYITKYIEKLYKYTPIDFKVIVVDGSLEQSEAVKNRNRVHLWINSYRNLGFSKGNNTGAILALREKPNHIVFCNDDVEFISSNWWQGIMDTFNIDKQIIGVNPSSARIAMWGYGIDGYLDLIDHKEEFTEEDYQFLLRGDFEQIKATKKAKTTDGSEFAIPASFPGKQSGVIDAVATWCTVFKADKFEEIGLWDERFFPGSGEDYDMMARAYSRAYPDPSKTGEGQHYRVVGTSRSWAWHWWTRSKDYFKENPEAREKLMTVRPNFSDAGDPWRKQNEGNFDVWGNWEKDGQKIPLIREKRIVVESL